MGCNSTKLGHEQTSVLQTSDIPLQIWEEFCKESYRAKKYEDIDEMLLHEEILLYIGYFSKRVDYNDAGILNIHINLKKSGKCGLAIICDNVDDPTYFDAYMIVFKDKEVIK
ncbi:MAG TPA: hypothetical protein PKD85_06660 [Saprospiraceae bacterium]|nr:hypothetical protein [Saprospiraceae bacterium]